MQTSRSRFIVGEYIIEPRLNRISGPEGVTVVEPKVMHVLTCLADQPGEVLTKDALIEKVWEGTVVTDYVVSRSISQLRKIFEDSYKAPSYIETVSKTGYRLIADVSVSGSDSAPPDLSRYGDSQPRSELEIEVVPHPQPAVQPAASSTSVKKQWHTWQVVALIALVAVTFAWAGNRLADNRPTAPLSASLFTSNVGMELSPAFSPDGSMIAYVRFNQATQYDLYVKKIGGSSELRLTDEPGTDYFPAWTSDSGHITFQRIGNGTCEVYQIGALGGMERKIMDCHPAQRNLNWAPDGSSFLIVHGNQDRSLQHVVQIDAETLERTPLTSPPAEYADFRPAYSPDGSKIAFTRGFYGEIADLYVMPSTGGEPQRLTYDNRDISGFTWAPDSRSIMMASNRSGNYRLWNVDISDGDVEWVSDVATLDPGGPSLSSTGEHLVYEEWIFELNIWEVALYSSNEAGADTIGTMAQRFTSTRSDFQPDYSPDGERVVYVSNKSGRPEIWTGDSDGTNTSLLVSLDDAYIQLPRWSPDGAHILFSAFVDGHTHLFTVDSQGGQPVQRSSSPVEHRLPFWSRDGQWIYFTSNKEDGWQLWKIPLASGSEERVTSNGGYFGNESLDGQTLYYSKLDEPGLWQKPMDGEEELVLEGLQRVDWGNWVIAETGLYYYNRTRPGVHITRYDLETGSETSIASFPGYQVSHEPGMTVSPDGSRLLFTRTDRSESDLMLVEIEPTRMSW